MRPSFTAQAEADVVRQYRFYLVEKESPETAIRFRDAVREAAQAINERPGIGNPTSSRILGLRSWPLRDFESIRVYYREAGKGIEVVRVLHGRRNLRAILRKPSI